MKVSQLLGLRFRHCARLMALQKVLAANKLRQGLQAVNGFLAHNARLAFQLEANGACLVSCLRTDMCRVSYMSKMRTWLRWIEGGRLHASVHQVTRRWFLRSMVVSLATVGIL